jgi:penicillin-binding protein-related factor A (putative recombinase)
MNDATRRLNPQMHALLGGDTRPRSNWANDGRAFQEEIELTCGAYNLAGIATIKKVDPPTRIVGSKEDRRVIFLPNPFLDYVGAWTARHSRAIFFEAKSTSEPRLKLGSGGLTDSQINALGSWRLAAAATFVLWQHAGEVRLFTVEAIRWATSRGDRSLAFANGAPVRQGSATIIWDFLPVAAAQFWPAQANCSP